MTAGPARAQLVACLLQEWMAEGHLVGGQIYVSQDDAVVADVAAGGAGNGAPMTTETFLPWLCCGKPVVAAAVLAALERADVGLHVPLSDILAELGEQWRGVDVTHALTHTIPLLDTTGRRHTRRDPLTTKFYLSAATCLRLVAEARLWAEPGTVAQYSPWAGWLLLARLIEELTGQTAATYIAATVLQPAGMASTAAGLGVGGVARLGKANATMTDLRRGGHRPLWGSEERRLQERPLPGSGLRGPAHDLGRFAERILLGDGGGVIDAATVKAMVHPHRVGLVDAAALIEAEPTGYDWGLGIMADHRPFPGCEPGTVGHFGLQCTLFFADSSRRVVTVALLNGQTERLTNRRRREQLGAVVAAITS